MEQEFSIKLLTSYISVWGWQILAMLFLTSSLMMLSLPTKDFSLAFFMAFFMVFIICEFISIRKKYEIYDLK